MDISRMDNPSVNRDIRPMNSDELQASKQRENANAKEEKR